MRLLLATLLLLALLAAPAWGQSGGTFYAPPAGGAAAGNGSAQAPPEKPAAKRKPAKRKPARRKRARRKRARRRSAGPRLEALSVSRPRLFLLGRSARVRFRFGGRSRVHARLALVPAKGGKASSRIDLGERAPGVTHSVALTGRENGTLPQGRYLVRIGGRDRRGRRLRAGASASASTGLAFFHHCFPIAGAFSFGGTGSRFGSGRKGHTHQGQDMAAAQGTPVVAPRGGTVEAVQYQRGGAGHYVVVDGDGENRDYVFMHLKAGSIAVGEGQRVRTGQRIGDVGSTGSSSGPHLHFEVWVGGWYARKGRPVDPLRLLRAWDSWS